MNAFDVIIVLALLAGAAWGFMKGVIHQIVGLFLIYFGLVVSTLLYWMMAPFVAQLIKLDIRAAGAISFLFLLIVSINIAGFALRDVRRREYRVLRLVNQLGGMTFGFVAASVWIAIAVGLLWYAAGGSAATFPTTGAPVLLELRSETIRQAIVVGLINSPLVNAFSVLLPLILGSVSPFVPAKSILDIFVFR
jgi:uncharacterized membrane protein required for colicin V production